MAKEWSIYAIDCPKCNAALSIRVKVREVSDGHFKVHLPQCRKCRYRDSVFNWL